MHAYCLFLAIYRVALHAISTGLASGKILKKKVHTKQSAVTTKERMYLIMKTLEV